MRLLENPKAYLGKALVGLVANATTVNAALKHAAPLFAAHEDINLVRLFGPEHGIYGVAQDMVEVGDARDPWTGLPIKSLYGAEEKSLAPRAGDLDGIDLLVFDIQDIGSRYYTYAATMSLCMRAAAEARVKVLVLDRPNPLNGVQIEGGGIEPGLTSFVGLYPVPQRHGLTLGELARLYNTAFGIGCELEIVPCESWDRRTYFDATGLPWVTPSPNMPTLDTAIVYPGMCLFEGTNLSEGRGTTRPFELVGAPFIDGRALAEELRRFDLPGVLFRPCFFTPTFNKFEGVVCGGIQLHVTDRQHFLSYRTGLAVLTAVRRLWPQTLAWRTDTYEFRNDVPAIDLLTGSAKVRQAIDAGEPFDRIMERALAGSEQFFAARLQALLY